MNLKKITPNLFGFLKDARLRQSTMLLGSMVLAMGINFIASIITARELGPNNYGDAKFIQIMWSLMTLLSSFGLFHSGSRILVIEKDPEKLREITGSILLISLLIGIGLNILTAVIALPVDSFFHTHVSNYLLRLSPVVFLLSVQAALTLVLQGVNQIFLLSILNIVPQLLYLIVILILSRLHLITTVTILLANQLTFLPAILFIVFWLRPSLRSTKYWWNVILTHNKTYGGPVYLGSLANVASSYINRLAISYWVDNTSIGFYSLANSLTEPLKLVPNAVATSSFRSFAKEDRIPRKILLATVGFSLMSLAVALLFFGTPLSWIYTKDFAPVSAMARAMSVGAIMVGFGDFFNRFLGAHGKGSALRNVAYLVGGVNVAGFLLLVPLWGAWGVICTSVLSGFTYFLFMYRYYIKHTAELKPTEANGSSEAIGNGSKVVILLDSFGFPNGMAATRRVQLIARMLVQNGFQVKVLCARAIERQSSMINKEVQGVYEGISFEYTPGRTIRSDSFLVRRYFDIKGVVVAMMRLATYRKTHQVDCIYYYGNILHNTPNRWIFYSTAKILGVPIVTDMSEPPWVLNQRPGVVARFLSPLMGVDGVILISNFLKEWVISETSKSQKIIPILHLPVLVDVNEQEISNFNVSKPNMAVLFAGSGRTTLEFIIQAMERVWLVYPDCKLIVTGYSQNNLRKTWLKNSAHSDTTAGNVDIAGYLPRVELLKLYQNVSALLIPLFDDVRSQARFPTKIAEYLCSGTPMVTCRVGEVERYLKNGVTAYVSDPDSPEKYASKIIEAIDPQNCGKSREVGRNGRDMAGLYFDVRNYKEPILTFFSSICNKTAV
jgi:O-antigen/teichoic acid export membrane protein/glycosyltransferase involved in cell wall biosynthesis